MPQLDEGLIKDLFPKLASRLAAEREMLARAHGPNTRQQAGNGGQGTPCTDMVQKLNQCVGDAKKAAATIASFRGRIGSNVLTPSDERNLANFVGDR